ncbi:MAG TPA: glucose-1-phosphate adenylyltransferase [Nitrospira sp.]|nr:glucose-1-phosphate adenylyltransferase [Nitrospira sp.]
MRRLRVLGMIMAGGKGERLMPLTAVRSKPAVPFGGKYRIVDFVLSNMLNSGITANYVLVQYRSQSLIEHVRESWSIAGRLKDQFITVVPPQMRAGGGWYEGTADAVYHNLNLIADFRPDVVAVFGADHIYRMDVSQMIQFHQDSGAEVTVAALPVPSEQSSQFGILEVDADDRLVGFEEKPAKAKAMSGCPTMALSSMGNYIFDASVLLRTLERDAASPGSHDFGRNIIPDLIGGRRKVFAYDFLRNDVPGLRSYEERGYWRDVGTLDAYWQANMDLLGETPSFDLRNNQWPVVSAGYESPMASIVRTYTDQSMIGQGSHIVDAEIRNSVIGRDVHIEVGARLEGCIIMDGVRIGAQARLHRVIADRFSSIPAGSDIGFQESPQLPGCHLSPTGLVIIPRDTKVAMTLMQSVS